MINLYEQYIKDDPERVKSISDLDSTKVDELFAYFTSVNNRDRTDLEDEFWQYFRFWDKQDCSYEFFMRLYAWYSEKVKK